MTFLLPLICFVLLAAIGAVALYGTLSGTRDPTQLPSVLIGKPAPSIELPALGAEESRTLVTVGMFRGRPLLVNFFASWCAPCRAEAPALETLSKRIAVMGIAYKDRDIDTREFLSQYGNPYSAIGMDSDGRVGIEWGVYGVPETYLIGADGMVKFRHAGPLTRGVIENNLMPVLKSLRS